MNPDRDALLREVDPLRARVARHGHMTNEALFSVFASVPIGYLIASISEHCAAPRIREFFLWLAWVPFAAAVLCFIWQRTAQRLAAGRLKDPATTAKEIAAENPTMPVATMLWMAARRRAWDDLRRPVFWLSGEIGLLAISWALGRWSPELAEAVWFLPLVFTPFTAVTVIMRATEFIIVSQWSWHERQMEKAEIATHTSQP